MSSWYKPNPSLPRLEFDYDDECIDDAIERDAMNVAIRLTAKSSPLLSQLKRLRFLAITEIDDDDISNLPVLPTVRELRLPPLRDPNTLSAILQCVPNVVYIEVAMLTPSSYQSAPAWESLKQLKTLVASVAFCMKLDESPFWCTILRQVEYLYIDRIHGIPIELPEPRITVSLRNCHQLKHVWYPRGLVQNFFQFRTANTVVTMHKDGHLMANDILIQKKTDAEFFAAINGDALTIIRP